VGSNKNAYTLVFSVAVDTKNNVYVSSNTSVRKLVPGGGVTTIAGKPYVRGHSLLCDTDGEGDLATKARIVASSLAVDRAGDVYLMGLGLRKVDPAGRITTIVHDSQVYVDNGKCTSHQHVVLQAVNSGPAIKAHIKGGREAAVAAAPNGSVYVTDGRNRVLKIG